MLEQLINRDFFPTEQTNPNTGRAVIVFSAEMIGLSNRITNLFRDQFYHGGCHFDILMEPFQHHYEFITPKAGRCVAFSNAMFAPVCHHLQELVTHVMAAGIVEVLEVVEVNKQQGTMLTCSSTGRLGLMYAISQ